MRALDVLDSRYNSYEDMFTDEELEQILEPTSTDPSEIISYAYSAYMLSHVLTHGDKSVHKFLDDDRITEAEIDEVPRNPKKYPRSRHQCFKRTLEE